MCRFVRHEVLPLAFLSLCCGRPFHRSAIAFSWQAGEALAAFGLPEVVPILEQRPASWH